MPGYKGHLVGGLTLAMLVLAGIAWLGLYMPDPVTAGALTLVAVLAALFPDVDTDSKGQRLYYALLVAVDLGLILLGLYVWAAVLGLFAMFPALGAHRGWTHTWWAMLLVPSPLIVLPWWLLALPVERSAPFYVAAVVGYASHLLLDGKWK